MSSKKKKMVKECISMVDNVYEDGGIADLPFCDVFIADAFKEMIPHLNKKGLLYLKRKMDKFRKVARVIH